MLSWFFLVLKRSAITFGFFLADLTHEIIIQRFCNFRSSCHFLFFFNFSTLLCGHGGKLPKIVRKIRPPWHKAYLSLSFDPGDCAQVDWGYAGMIDVGSTRRWLSFFVMVMCYSHMMYVEFTLSETQEQFLACHEHAFEYFGKCPKRVMVDNLKSAVLSHPRGHQALYHPRFVDFAGHYGFEICACNVGAPNEKSRVENGVKYVKSSFLRGMDNMRIAAINPAAKIWLDTVANVRKHAVTRKRPVDMFKEERNLRLQRRKAREQQRLMHLLRLSPNDEEYYHQLEKCRLNPAVHIRKIVAPSEIYGNEAVSRAIDEALEYHAYSSEYIANILEQRNRSLPEAGALHLTRREDLLDLERPEPDLSIYDT